MDLVNGANPLARKKTGISESQNPKLIQGLQGMVLPLKLHEVPGDKTFENENKTKHKPRGLVYL